LAKAERVIYKHKDMSDLENKIKKHKKKNNLIVTDGVFSMDGDIAPLKDIKFLGKKYGIKVMVDDAHASGLLGKNGRGTAEHFNIENVDITMDTFTKAFGGVGGFIAGSKDLIDYLRVTARTYIFSAPIPPAVSAGLIEAIKIASIDNKLRENLWNNVKHVREELKKMGFNILGETNIIPILVGNEKRAVAFSRELFENNVFIPAVRWPAVPEGQARLRLTIMATHEKEQIDHLLNILQKTGKTLGVI
jgi:7-keto-8-aminopelargonate synthetase-like enzyme